MTQYRSTQTVDAREVGEGGESVVTPAGIVQAAEGQYVVSHPGGDVTVADADAFEDAWAPEDSTDSKESKPSGKAADDPFKPDNSKK
jgi:hypothetical protein